MSSSPGPMAAAKTPSMRPRGRVRAVIMNDAGIGKDKAGIVGLDFLDQIGLVAATADARTFHIGDGDHVLAHGVISYVNRTAAACAPGQSVRNCAERMRAAIVPTLTSPPSPSAPASSCVTFLASQC